jgi:hypothetical protein
MSHWSPTFLWGEEDPPPTIMSFKILELYKLNCCLERDLILITRWRFYIIMLEFKSWDLFLWMKRLAWCQCAKDFSRQVCALDDFAAKDLSCYPFYFLYIRFFKVLSNLEFEKAGIGLSCIFRLYESIATGLWSTRGIKFIGVILVFHPFKVLLSLWNFKRRSFYGFSTYS